MLQLQKGKVCNMSTKRKGVFMTNIYFSSTVKQHKPSFLLKQESDEDILRFEIASGFSTRCTKALLMAIHQMTKEITYCVTSDFISKGSK